MRGIFAKISGFIKGIQRADDATKRRWLIIFSGAGILAVIVLWVAYLNVTLPRSAMMPETTPTPTAVQPKPESGPSFFETLGLGWETVWSGIKNGANSLEESAGNGWLKFREQLNRTNDMKLENPASTPAAN